MAVDPILGWTLIAEVEDDPFVRANEIGERITQATQRAIDIVVTAGGTITISAADMDANTHFNLTGSPSGAFNVDVQDGDRKFVMSNKSGEAATIDTVGGSASTFVLPNNTKAHFQNDGIELEKTADVGNPSGAILFADGSQAPSANFDWNDKNFNNIQFKDYHETDSSPTISSGAITFDIANGNTFIVDLTENVTTITTTGLHATETTSFTVIWKQDPATPRTVTFPTAYKWPGGTPPTITATTNAVDITVHMSDDAGTNVYSFVGGQAFA